MLTQRIDRLVRLEIEGHLLLLALVGQDGPDEQHETIGRDTVVKFETLLGTRDGSQYRLPVHTRLDVRCSTVLLRQHVCSTRNLILIGESLR